MDIYPCCPLLGRWSPWLHYYLGTTSSIYLGNIIRSESLPVTTSSSSRTFENPASLSHYLHEQLKYHAHWFDKVSGDLSEPVLPTD